MPVSVPVQVGETVAPYTPAGSGIRTLLPAPVGIAKVRAVTAWPSEFGSGSETVGVFAPVLTTSSARPLPQGSTSPDADGAVAARVAPACGGVWTVYVVAI